MQLVSINVAFQLVLNVRSVESYKRTKKIEIRSGVMSKDKIEKFKKAWLEEITKIEKRAIDSHGVYLLHLRFRIDRGIFNLGLNRAEFTYDVMLELNLLESKLRVALETARSRYRLQNRSLWARIIEAISGMIYKIPKKL